MIKKELEQLPFISLETFLRHYLKVNNDHMIKSFKDLTHQDFKEAYEDLYDFKLKRMPFDFIAVEDILRGDILLVADKKRHLAPYINPIQINFDLLIEEERKKQIEKQNSFQTYEEYTDEIDNIVLYKGISNNKIKVLSQRRHMNRKED